MLEEGTPGGRTDPDDAVIAAFRDQARYLAEWEWRRAEGFQQKAGFLLGGSGVVLALSVGSLDDVASWWLRAAALVAVGAFVLCAGTAAVVLRPRKFTFASHEQLRREWNEYTEGRQVLPWQVSSLSVSSLLLPAGDRKPSLRSLNDDATTRGRWFKWSVRCFVTGLASIAVFAVMIVFQGGFDA